MSVLLTAEQAKEISQTNKEAFTKKWIVDHLDAAIREAAALGYNRLYLAYTDTSYAGWGSCEKEGQYFCPWGDNIDFNIVRSELEPLGYGITNSVYSVEKAIAYISWY